MPQTIAHKFQVPSAPPSYLVYLHFMMIKLCHGFQSLYASLKGGIRNIYQIQVSSLHAAPLASSPTLLLHFILGNRANLRHSFHSIHTAPHRPSSDGACLYSSIENGLSIFAGNPSSNDDDNSRHPKRRQPRTTTTATTTIPSRADCVQRFVQTHSAERERAREEEYFRRQQWN